MSGIKLFVGLGNPGNKYSTTRHNAGYWWIDQVATTTKSKLVSELKFFGQAGKLNPTQDTWLLKPGTFMNASGKSVAALANYYKISPNQILVVHDELDLEPNTVKLKKGGGIGGHNGLKDIAASLGTQDFWRLRLGIGHPGNREEVINFVLNTPLPKEKTEITQCIDDSLEVLPNLLKGDFESAMLKLHTKK